MLRHAILGVFLASFLGATGCAALFGGDNDAPPRPTNSTGDQGFEGDACASSDDCIGELVCAGDDTCQFPGASGTTPLGGPCASSTQCQAGLACASDATCQPDGEPGTAGQGEACGEPEDCQLGLQCIGEVCAGFQPPLWAGQTCPSPDADEGPFRGYFEVPDFAAGDEPAEFYRLPFPNDIRVIDGHIVLDGHPSPGALIPEIGDVVGEILDILEQDVSAWGNNAGVFLRFSGRLDFDSLVVGLPPGAGTDEGTIGIVDITPGSDSYGERHAGGWYSSSGATPYICTNWLHLRVGDGRPLAPGHTYAAFASTGVTERDTGAAAAQDADFTALLAAAAPSGARLAGAWEAYAPLRSYLADQGVDPAALATAAVFTVGDPVTPVQKLREATRAAAAPVVAGLHLCDDEPGPYADAADPERGCHGAPVAFHELQGTVSIPHFQSGTPPFKTIADGGAIDFPDDGLPVVTYTDEVVFSLSIPRDLPMPATGWPVVIYGHGTGGNYRSAMRSDNVAEWLSDVELADGSHVGFAVLAYDGVMHGPRRHPENWDQAWLDLDAGAYDPDVLFFSAFNPRAARDNPLQGAVDKFALVRAIEEGAFDGPAPDDSSADLLLDASRILYMGHSQGSTTGVAAVSLEPGIHAAVFSGAGGLLIESLLNKTKPYDFPSALKVALADPEIGREHPVLNLVQAGAESSDAINFGALVQDTPPAGVQPHHVLQTYGIGDSYTPEVTQHALARALRVEQVTNGNEPLAGIGQEDLPASGNRDGVTAIVALYQPEGDNDGHFVVFDRADAREQVVQFLATALGDDAPTVVEPSAAR